MVLPAIRFRCFGLLVFAVVTAACTLNAQEVSDRVEEYMQAAVKVNRFSGSILIARDGKVLVSKGYGMANLEWEIPNTPNTRFRLGSITKQFTSMSIMQLQERGKLDVQDPICKYIETCPETWKAITIHHLLTHTSGIPSYTSSPDYRKLMTMPVTTADMVARFRDKALDFPPGEKYTYNNSGYFLLGTIIEKVSGKPYEDYLRENIFQPLEMKDSGYDRPAAILSRRASGYGGAGDKLVNAAYLDMIQPYSAGALYSTVEDLYRWDQALYTEKVVKKNTLDRIWTPFKDNYAYGWQVAPRFNRKFVGHGGGINGFVTDISRYPDDRACVIVLSNFERGAAGRVSRDLAAILFGEKYELPKERTAMTLDPAVLDSYVGRYELTPGFVLAIAREGNGLTVQATGQSKIALYAEAPMRFFAKDVEIEITFEKDEKGAVPQLMLRQGGGNRPARKLP